VKPRAEKPNPHKRARQEAKAARFTLAIEDLAEGTPLSPLEVFARLDEKQWLTLAVIIGQKKPTVPSPETQLMILGLLREREAEGAAA
jgi:hypothetical protein